MGIKFNPLVFSGLIFSSGGGGTSSFKPPVSDQASLPIAGSFDGDTRVTLDTQDIYVYDAVNSRWENKTLQTSVVGSVPNSNGYSFSIDETIPGIRLVNLELQPANQTNPGVVTSITQSFGGDKTFTDDVIIEGNLTVNGTEVIINTITLEVEDNNILVNKGGSDATSEGAGLTVERVGTNGSLFYENALASKFKIGDAGSEVEIATVSDTQTLSNKTISASNNTISGLLNISIGANAAIDATKIHDGSVSNAEYGFLDGVTSLIQAQLDNKQPLDATLTSLAAFNSDGLLVQTAADTFVSRQIAAGSAIVVVTNANGVAGNPTLDVDVTEIDHDQLFNFVPNEHVDHSSVVLSAGVGLTGGGDITVSRTLNLADTAVVAATYGSASNIPTFTVDQQGRLTASADVAVSITSSNITDFTEAAQDAVAASLVDSASIDFTYNDVLNTITASVLPAGVDHNLLLNYVANQHVDHSAVNIDTAATTSGLAGGGDLTATRSLSVDITGTQALAGPIADNDELLVYDASSTSLRKVTRAGIINQTVGDITELSAALVNNTSGTVAGLAFVNAQVRSAKVQYSMVVDATSPLYESGTLELIQRGTDWALSRDFSGNDSLVELDVNSSGQITYVTPAYAGFASATMKFRATVTTI